MENIDQIEKWEKWEKCVVMRLSNREVKLRQ